MSGVEPVAVSATPIPGHGEAAEPDADPGHGDGSRHGHGSSHGHDPEAELLGPPDLIAWAYAIAGGVLGLIVAVALYAASHS